MHTRLRHIYLLCLAAGTPQLGSAVCVFVDLLDYPAGRGGLEGVSQESLNTMPRVVSAVLCIHLSFKLPEGVTP